MKQNNLDELVREANSGDSVAAKQIEYRNGARNISLRAQSIDEEARTVEAVIASELPVSMWDYKFYDYIDEVLAVEGMEIRGGRAQIPLLDNHQQGGSIDNILGRADNFRIEGDLFLAKIHFDDDEKSTNAFNKIKNGSLTDLSIGYYIKEYTYLGEEETKEISNKRYVGPMKLVTKTEIMEVSCTPIGADTLATFRSNNKINKPKEEVIAMSEKVEKGQEPKIDTEALRKEAIETERKRVSEIRTLALNANIESEEVNSLIDEGATVEEARAKFLDILSTKNKSSAKPVLENVADERDKFRAAATQGLTARMTGSQKDRNEYSRLSIRQIAEEALEKSGVNRSKFARLSNEDVLAMAYSGHRGGAKFHGSEARAMNHTTSDFPLLLANSANKVITNAWDLTAVSYPSIARTESVNDFKTNTRVRLSEGPVLDKITENGEITEGNIYEEGETYKIDTYATKITLTRQAIINDDLGGFARKLAQSASFARRKINRVVVNTLTDNAAMSDGTALFHTDHANLGTGAAISLTTIGELKKLMRVQTGQNGYPLNITPQVFLVPGELETTAYQFVSPYVMPDSASNVNPDWVRNLVVIPEAELDAAGITAGYYMIANPAIYDTIELGLLNGVDAPIVEELDSGDVLGSVFAVYVDFGAKALDWKAMAYNAGS